MTTSIRTPRPVYSPELLVTHHGVPLGTMRAYLTSGALIVGELRVDRAYVAIRDLIRRASASLWAVGFLAEMPGVPQPNAPVDAVTRAAELPLELRDASGSLVWADFVNIVERPDPAEPPVVFARLRLAPAAKPAPVASPRNNGHGQQGLVA